MNDYEKRVRAQCWCGLKMRQIPTELILNGETFECNANCKKRYLEDGVSEPPQEAAWQ